MTFHRLRGERGGGPRPGALHRVGGSAHLVCSCLLALRTELGRDGSWLEGIPLPRPHPNRTHPNTAPPPPTRALQRRNPSLSLRCTPGCACASTMRNANTILAASHHAFWMSPVRGSGKATHRGAADARLPARRTTVWAKLSQWWGVRALSSKAAARRGREGGREGKE